MLRQLVVAGTARPRQRSMRDRFLIVRRSDHASSFPAPQGQETACGVQIVMARNAKSEDYEKDSNDSIYEVAASRIASIEKS